MEEMRVQVEQFRKPLAKTMEEIYERYKQQCLSQQPRLKEIEVVESGVNWKAVIQSLPKDQVANVLGCGIRRIWLKEAECVYDGIYRFHVERRDGTLASFEWRDAYNDAYHGYKGRSFKDHVETALRAAILKNLTFFKELLMKENQMELHSHISGVALPWEKAVVQHFPTNFMTLVDAFLNEVNLDMDQIKVEYDEYHVYMIKDPVLLERWQTYHSMQANFRIISIEEAMLEPNL